MATHRNVVICLSEGDEDKQQVGFVNVHVNAHYSDLRREIQEDELEALEGKEFVFLGERKLALSKKQEARFIVNEDEVCVKIVGVSADNQPIQPTKRRKLVLVEEEDVEVITMEGVSTNIKQEDDIEPIEALESQESMSRLQSKIATRSLTNKWLYAYRRAKMKMKLEGKKDRFELMSYDFNGAAVFCIWCVECHARYGKGGEDMMYNYTARHVQSKEHKMNLQSNLDATQENVSEVSSKEDIIAENKADVEACMATKVRPFVEETHVDFDLYNETLGGFVRKEDICIVCKLCNKPLRLFPDRGDVVENMKEHIKSTRHAQKWAANERKENECQAPRQIGRPRREIVVDASQKNMLAFFLREPGTQSEAECSTSRNLYLASLCWGFWQLKYRYGSNTRDLRTFLDESKAGRNWYCEPMLNASFEHDGRVICIAGTFRHVSCRRICESGQQFSNLQCSFCASIPKESDFRMRIYRQERGKVSRGLRRTNQHIRVDYLTNTELKDIAKASRAENRLLRKDLMFCKRKNVALSVKVRTIRDSLCESMNRADVKKFCRDIVEAHTRGKFEGKTALWNFLTDVAQNIIRPGHKRRYKKTTKDLFETIKIWGGQRMHNFLSINFSGPSLSTTLRSTRKNFVYKCGIREETFAFLGGVYSSHMTRIGLPLGSVPSIVAEDETVIKRAVQWIARDDTLIGFCGLKEGHTCEMNFVVHVGSGEVGYTTIMDAFELNTIAHFARVLIVNPLHPRLPRLVLSIQLTCNKFNHDEVRIQWQKVQAFWDSHLRHVLGPLIGHSSDGDARRRACMLEDYTSLKQVNGRYAIPWEGWVFTAAIRDDGSICGLHDQDFIHNGKKLINPMDNASRRLYLGNEYVTLNDVWHVFNMFQGEHGLQLGDVERKDRQNWRAAQRIASRKVQGCLQRLRDPSTSKPMRTLGTEIYLHVVSHYIDIFLSPHLDLRARVKAASTVSFFFRLWRLWIINHETHSLSKNFISRETFLDIQLSCHFVVLLVRYFNETCTGMAVPLHCTGSDCCENFFSKVGGMVRNERSYTGADLLETCNALNRVAEFQALGDLLFPAAHIKQENIWQVLERKVDNAGNEIRADLCDLSEVSTNDKIVDALKDGFKYAQALCAQVGITCDKEGAETWWETPWKHEDYFHRDYFKQLDTTQIEDESDVVEIEEDNTSTRDNSASESHDIVAEMELRHTFEAMLDETEISHSQVDRTVKVDGKLVCKATLVSQLNGNPWLSKDRLTKVKHHDFPDANSKVVNAATSLGIGSDCAVYFENDEELSKRMRAGGREQQKSLVWYLGRVLSIRKKIGRAWKESRESIDLIDRPSYLVELNLAWYNEHKTGRRTWFTYDNVDNQVISLDSVISLACLTYKPENGRYFLDDNDRRQFNGFLNDQMKGV